MILIFLKKPFIRNVTIVASGTAVAQVVALVFSPLLTRIYGPEAFGLLGVFSSLAAMLIYISDLTYSNAIVIPREDSEAWGLVKISIYVTCCVCCLVVLALLLVGGDLLIILRSEAIASYVYLIPLSMLFVAFSQIGKQWLIRKNQFYVTAKVTVLQGLGYNISQALVGYFYPLGASLVILSTLSHGLTAFLLWYGIKQSGCLDLSVLSDKEPKIHLKTLALQYNDFPFFRAPQVLINAVSQNLPVLILASFFGTVYSGFFTLGAKVLSLPTQLISQSVAQVFYPRVAQAAQNGEQIQGLILRATLVLLSIGIIPFGIIFIFGPYLFGLLFGHEWIRAGQYARWLALWAFAKFINSPSLAAIPVIRMQKWYLFYEIFAGVIRIAALFCGWFFFKNDLIAVALFSFFATGLYLWLIVKVVHSSSLFSTLTKKM